MKRLMFMLTVSICGTCLIAAAPLDDADDIKAATVAHFAALNVGDADTHVQQHLPDSTEFPSDGGLLVENDSLENQKKILQAQFDAGLKVDYQLRHLKVKIYEDTAVVTGYLVGTVTLPGGETQQNFIGRRTAVLIKQGDQWKEVHAHSSPLITPPPQ